MSEKGQGISRTRVVTGVIVTGLGGGLDRTLNVGATFFVGGECSIGGFGLAEKYRVDELTEGMFIKEKRRRGR